MTNYRRRATREWRVALSNGESLRIIAISPQAALKRASVRCAKLNSESPNKMITIGTIVEVEN